MNLTVRDGQPVGGSALIDEVKLPHLSQCFQEPLRQVNRKVVEKIATNTVAGWAKLYRGPIEYDNFQVGKYTMFPT